MTQPHFYAWRVVVIEKSIYRESEHDDFKPKNHLVEYWFYENQDANNLCELIRKVQAEKLLTLAPEIHEGPQFRKLPMPHIHEQGELTMWHRLIDRPTVEEKKP